jgi:hypothetical protein
VAGHAADDGGRVVTHQHESTPVAAVAAAAPAAPDPAAPRLTRSHQRAAVTTTGGRHRSTDTRTQTRSGSPRPAGTDDGACGSEHGNAYGHERAPGWQKNWGEGGRHPGHDDGSQPGDSADCT